MDKDRRGSAANRRARRSWLLSPESGFGGDRKSVPCYHCGTRLTPSMMEVDRFPVCGHDGGSYRRDNIVPSCRGCNLWRCDGCLGARKRNDGLFPREVGYRPTESDLLEEAEYA